MNKAAAVRYLIENGDKIKYQNKLVALCILVDANLRDCVENGKEASGTCDLNCRDRRGKKKEVYFDWKVYSLSTGCLYVSINDGLGYCVGGECVRHNYIDELVRWI